jgi:hypothetical protein
MKAKLTLTYLLFLLLFSSCKKSDSVQPKQITFLQLQVLSDGHFGKAKITFTDSSYTVKDTANNPPVSYNWGYESHYYPGTIKISAYHLDSSAINIYIYQVFRKYSQNGWADSLVYKAGVYGKGKQSLTYILH